MLYAGCKKTAKEAESVNEITVKDVISKPDTEVT